MGERVGVCCSSREEEIKGACVEQERMTKLCLNEFLFTFYKN